MLQDEKTDVLLPAVQLQWAAKTIAQRLVILRGARHRMAAQAELFAAAISSDLARSPADTLVAELLPLLDAMRFLERQAARILAPRPLGSAGRPIWLAGLRSEVQRIPLGHILVIGPANFPLFLPGVQVIQALAAGNAVTWKPGLGGERVARLVLLALREAGLPLGLLRVTGEHVEDAQAALAERPDKVIFTGSFPSGRQVLAKLAETATPAVMELSGADAVIILPSADLTLAARAIAFGLRFNGAEVCMSPRRLVATADVWRELRPLLQEELGKIAPVFLKPRTSAFLQQLLQEAQSQGATLVGTFAPEAQRPILVQGVQPEMTIATSNLFAPVLSILEAPSVLHLPEIVNRSPYALSAAIFGAVGEARALGEQLRVGTVVVNDLIAPTADPRVPFCGRGKSGFGATRGAEGLLEMTAVKTVLVRRQGKARHFNLVGMRELPLFAGLIGTLHGGSLRERFGALRRLAGAGRTRATAL